MISSLLLRRTDLQVTLIGMGAFLGGMITLTPEWRQPRIAPPRASTMKETRNLKKTVVNVDAVIPLTTVSWSSESRCEATDKLKVSRRYFRGFTFGALMVFARQSLKKMFKLSLMLTIEVSVPNNFFSAPFWLAGKSCLATKAWMCKVWSRGKLYVSLFAFW